MTNIVHDRKITAAFVLVLFGIYLVFAPFAKAYELVITGNGSDSDNTVSVEVQSETTVVQENEAKVVNDIETEAVTGENSATGNSNDTVVVTGNIEQEVVVDNKLNESVAVVDNCCQQDTSAKISANGSGSQNYISINSTNSTNVDVNQAASVTNSVDGYANTGGNSANYNGGDVVINTGNIKVSGAILNDVNNSNVNVNSGGAGFNANISGNGVASYNFINANISNNNNVNVTNSSFLNNFVEWFLNTGLNNAKGNNGSVSIITGDILFDFLIGNKANNSTVIVDCCKVEDPDIKAPEVDDPKDPADPSDKQDEAKKEGVLLPIAASTEFMPLGGPMILGLSDTSSEAAKTLFFWLGLGLMVLGLKVLGQELQLSTSINKSGRKN
jgi:hypothetical protein